jgi:hypothetical protein
LNKLLRTFTSLFLGAGLFAGSFAYSQEIVMTPQNLSQCRARTEFEMRSDLEKTLHSENSFALSTLHNFYPDFRSSQLRELKISVQNLNTKNGYRGFYKSHQGSGKKEILLDCALGSVLSWPSLLAHEITHALNENRRLVSWMDEMLAQIVEVNASPYVSYPKFDTIKRLNVIPSFFPDEKPFKSSQTYATNLLFGLYISENFRGYKAFQMLNHDILNLNDFATRLKKFTLGQAQFDYIREQISAENLIQYYVLALNINLPTRNGGTLYQIPGWSGFASDALIQASGSYIIEPGGFARISHALEDKLPKSLLVPVYRILKTKNTFKIQNAQDPVLGSWDENFFVLINTSLDQYLEVEL